MAEYLSPGVYVEEFDSGGVPVEGASTSIAGFIGVAERKDRSEAYRGWRLIFRISSRFMELIFPKGNVVIIVFWLMQ